MSVKGDVSATVAAEKLHSGFPPSEQCALQLFTVNYVIKPFKFTNEKNVSIRIAVMR